MSDTIELCPSHTGLSSSEESARGSDRVAADILAGGGETGALIRTIDWTNSPLGPVETWSPFLRTALSILLASEVAMFVWWGPGLVNLYNDGYRSVLGAKHPSALGQGASECWKEIWDVMAPLAARAFARGSSYIKDGLLFLDRHGYLEECYFNYAFSPVQDESGGVGGIFCVVTETTEKVLDARRLELLRQLSIRTALDRHVAGAFKSIEEVLAPAISDVAFALIYEVTGDTAMLVTCTGLTREAPAAPASLKLRDSSSWPVGDVSGSGQEVLVKDLDTRFGVLTVGAWPEPVTHALVLPLSVDADGNAITVLVAGLSPRLRRSDEYRSFIQLLARQIATSISSARALQLEKQRALELAELDRAKTAFFSSVSHEFRTPLTLILWPVEDALAQPEKSLSGEKLDLVQRNALRLQELVNTLLDFSRIEAGRVEARYRPTDLSALTIDLASAFRSLVEKAGLSLTIDCPALGEAVFVDREMYEKVVLNLLSNAFKFTLQGSIRVSLDAHEGRARLRVADTGLGIPELEIPHIFDRFHRVEGAEGRSYEGSGIGLALVRELASLQGGSVAVESRLGEGTCFTVSIPLGRSHLPAERVDLGVTPAVGAPGVAPFLGEASSWVPVAPIDSVSGSITDSLSPDGALFPGRSGHILLADDNADMREYVGKLLTAQGFEVETVGDGDAALERVRARVPDLVLADVMMPGLDGFGLLQALKADDRTNAVPVILLSARASEAASMEGIAKGADDYLVKPFSAKELVSRVVARLASAHQRAERLARERAVRQAAVTERQKLQALFMQAPIGVAILEGPEHTYTFANPSYRALVGGRDVVGKPLLEAVPDVEGQGIGAIMDEVVASGVPFIGNEFLVNLDRTGASQSEDVFYNLIYSPKLRAPGEVDGIFVGAVDVTEQVRARKRVESLLSELKLAEGRKDEFLAMLAHELRNPLAAINMALYLLERLDGGSAKAVRYRETAQRQMSNLLRLVDDLLDTARIGRGTVELRTEEVDLVSIFQSALTATRPEIEARGHTLSVSMASGVFPMSADGPRLEQVLVNLLTNAKKYTDPGGVISVRLTREEANGAGQAVLRVRDNGRGIPADMLDKVFDLFVQVSPTIDRSTGGLGLGLTLVKRLVELHGGSVSAHSDGPGKGSELVVLLPLKQDIKAPAAPLDYVEEPHPPAVFRKQHILIIEDAADLRESLKEYLESLGHEVTVTEDGLKGAARLLELRPDIALVDIGLPGIDGYEVARRARAAPEGDKLYLVALTGYGGPETKARARDAGFDLQVTKPADIHLLQQLVNRSRTTC